MSANISQTNHLGSQPIGKLLIRYAVPSIVSMVVNSLYNIVDQIFIAKGVGYIGNGATTVTFPLVIMGLSLSLLIGNGAAAFLSLQLGRGRGESGKIIVGNAVLLLGGAGLLMMIVTLAFQEPILRMMGASDTIMPHAIDYSRYIAMGFPFVTMSVGLSNLIRADGSPRYSMVSNLAGAALNTILDPIYIFVFGMGVKGAAIATAISQVVSCLITLYYVLKKGNHIRLEPAYLRPDPAVIRKMAVLGSSSFINQFSFTIVNVTLNNALIKYGALSPYGPDIPLSAMGIVMKINAIFISIILGVCIGAQPILGYNYGAQNFDRVKKTYKTEVAVTFALAAVASILFITSPQIFVALFKDENPLFNQFAAHTMRIYLCCVFAAGIQIPSASYFQAIGQPLKSMVLTLARQFLILVPAIMFLPRFFGLEGILYSMPVTDILALCLTLGFILKEMRRLQIAIPAGTPVQEV